MREMKISEGEKLKELIDHDMELPLTLGKTLINQNFIIDLVKMPHLLMGGKSKKESSSILNSIITSLVIKKDPSQLKFVFIECKENYRLDLSKINDSYLFPRKYTIEAGYHQEESMSILVDLIMEVDARFDFLKNARTRNIKEYNSKFNRNELNTEKGHVYMPYVILVIDEFADFVIRSDKQFLHGLLRIVQIARAVGIHVIINTHIISHQVINDLMNVHFPSRIAFNVSSVEELNILLDSPVANEQLDEGEMSVWIDRVFAKIQFRLKNNSPQTPEEAFIFV